jgi:hypothetical protein
MPLEMNTTKLGNQKQVCFGSCIFIETTVIINGLTFRSTRTLSLRASVLKQLSSRVPAAIGPVSFLR